MSPSAASAGDARPSSSPEPGAGPGEARAPGAADIEAAAARIAPHVRVTPLLAIDVDGREVELKLECLQVSGTFKARGAFARLTGAPADAPRHVVAASGGNHGIAVAHAARALGWRADVFVPRSAPAAKLARLAALGAAVHADGDEYAHAWEAARAFAAREGALVAHAYDGLDTLAGQGTLAREWLAQTAGVDALLVAVGGGGLIGGIAAWLDALALAGRAVPRLVAVESEGCPTLHAALAAGRIVEVAPRGIAADSLGARRVGEAMFPLARRRIADAVLVSDDAIRAAQARLWREARVAAEPGGAAAFAALASGAWRPQPGERVGVLACGANVDPRAIADALEVERSRPTASDDRRDRSGP